jgi:hypothetical protein
MSDNYFQSRTTNEIILALYVSFGFLIVFLTSLMTQNCLIFLIKYSIHDLLVLLIFSITAGIITYYTRKIIFDKRSFNTDSKIISEGEFYILLFTGILLGLVAFISMKYNLNNIYIISLVMLITTIGLNTYFSSFWLTISPINNKRAIVDILKLEHSEWSTIFGGLNIALIVSIAGLIFTYINSNNFSPFSYELIVILCIAIGTPIVWLLRPIHIAMVSIRKRISRMQSDEFE